MSITTNEIDIQELERLIALNSYDLAENVRDRCLEQITRIAGRICGTPMAAVSLIDDERQFHRFAYGASICDRDREGSLCAVVVRGAAPLVIADIAADDRFSRGDFPVEQGKLRFYAGVPLRTARGLNIGALCTMDTAPHHLDPDQIADLSDLAEIAMRIIELRQLSSTDSLTGAMTRRGFMNAAVQTMSLVRRHKLEMSIVSFDLDHFKSVNDTYGHAVGDVVLTNTVAACKKALRASDIIGRIGGEEFTIILPATGSKGSLQVAEKLRALIDAQRVITSLGELQVTGSFGVATLTPDDVTLEPCLERADLALYRAKTEGRNRCVEACNGSRS